MKTIDRYIAGIFSVNLIVSVLAMTLLFWFQSMFTDLYDHLHPMHQILTYHVLNVPQVMVQMAPPAVMLATVLTLSGMARSVELTACHAIGIGLQHIVTLLLVIVVLVSMLLLVMNDRILPPVFKKRTDYKYRIMQRKQDFFLDFKRDKIWYRSKNMIYNLQRFDPQSQLIHGMSIYTFDENFNLIQVVGAKKAAPSQNGGWKLLNGTIAIFPENDVFPLIQDFEHKDIVIQETPKDFQEIEKEVDGLRLKELYQYINRMKNAGADTKAFEVKFHSRISQSFIPIIMCLLAVPFSVGRRREGGIAKDLGFCLLMTLIYWLSYSISLALGTNGALPPVIAAWSCMFIFGALAIFLVLRRQEG